MKEVKVCSRHNRHSSQSALFALFTFIGGLDAQLQAPIRKHSAIQAKLIVAKDVVAAIPAIDRAWTLDILRRVFADRSEPLHRDGNHSAQEGEATSYPGETSQNWHQP